MAILVVGATTIPVATSAMQVVEIGGEEARMFDGSARSTVRARKRVWTITTPLLIAADRDTAAAALDAVPPLSCSGDLLGGTVNCIAHRTGEAEQWTKGQLRYAISFILTEQ